MGSTYNRGPHPAKKELIRIIHEAVDRGVTLFDTAEVYGPYNNEEHAGEALSAFKNKISVTTKFGHEIKNGKGTGGLDSRPEHIRKVAEESLKRLKVDSFELFYQHRLDPKVPIEDVAGTIKDLIKEGKVKRFGLCEVNADTIRRAHAVQPITAVQSEYHLMWRDVENKYFQLSRNLE
jgi:aryl-alcohol dehydrogenase-like predicted oxidoreductase